MLWIAILLVAAVPGAKPKTPEKPRISAQAAPDDALHHLFDDESLEVVRTATSVEVIRLKGDARNDYMTAEAADAEESVGPFAVQYRRVLEDAALVKNLQNAVLSASSYDGYRGDKLCGGFQPKVVFRFHSAGTSRFVDLLICFNCDDVGAIKVADAGSRTQEHLRVAHIDTHRALWSALATRALPDDPKIIPSDD